LKKKLHNKPCISMRQFIIYVGDVACNVSTSIRRCDAITFGMPCLKGMPNVWSSMALICRDLWIKIFSTQFPVEPIGFYTRPKIDKKHKIFANKVVHRS
jgi:hypothetical protein